MFPSAFAYRAPDSLEETLAALAEVGKAGGYTVIFDVQMAPYGATDVTDQVLLWDAGSEANEEPGAGPNQAPRQGGANTGAKDPDNTVRLVQDGWEGAEDPSATQRAAADSWPAVLERFVRFMGGAAS